MSEPVLNSPDGEFPEAVAPGVSPSALAEPWPPPMVAVGRTPGAPRLRAPVALLTAAFGLGWAAQAAFWGGDIGINLPLLVLGLVSVLVATSQREKVRARVANVAFLLPLLALFAAMAAVRANGALTFFNATACLVLVALIASHFAAGSVFRMPLLGFLGAPWKVLGQSLAHAAPFVLGVAGEAATADGRRRVAPVVRGVLLAVPVLGVFLALLYSADAVFARVLDDVAGWLLPEDWAVRFWRLMVALLLGLVFAGGMVLALTRREEGEGRTGAPAPKTPLGFTEGMILVGSVALLFAAFVGIQFAYLFGGHERVQAVPGLTYAEYARRGFAELNWTAVLTLALIGAVRRWGQRGGAGQERAFRGTATGLLGLTLVLLASAFQRMAAYEEAYGATEMRLWVDVFIVWLGGAILWFGATIWRDAPFGIGAFACALGALATLNALNPDAVIVRRNADLYARKQRMDTYYLYARSTDAIPDLVRIAGTLPAGSTARDAVTTHLWQEWQELSAWRARRPWYAWHAAHEHAYRLLQQNPAMRQEPRPPAPPVTTPAAPPAPGAAPASPPPPPAPPTGPAPSAAPPVPTR